MWRTARGQSRVHGILITAVVACLSLIMVSPSLVAAARAHSRTRQIAPKAARPAVRQPPDRILNPDHEILIRLESGQLALQKETAHLNAAVQRQMSQLSSAVEDSRKDTQQMLGQTAKRIDTIEKLLKIIVALLVLLCGGLLYIGWQLLSRPDKGLAWKGDIPDVPNFLAPGSDEEGIVGLRVRPRDFQDHVSSLGAGTTLGLLRSTGDAGNPRSGTEQDSESSGTISAIPAKVLSGGREE
jgi:hypothetical protein